MSESEIEQPQFEKKNSKETGKLHAARGLPDPRSYAV
jgi:hypothetical protein